MIPMIRLIPLDDIYIKNTRQFRETTHREPAEKAYYPTEFAVNRLTVCKTFIPTLEQFEKDLKTKTGENAST